MKIYCSFVKVKEKDESYHFNEESAKKTVSGIRYTDRSGMEHIGAHWTPEQIEIATASMKFPEGTTKWDKYVAFNLCRFEQSFR